MDLFQCQKTHLFLHHKFPQNRYISVDHVVKEIYINPDEGSKMFQSWLMGKKYTVTLTFKLDEILWDPAVEDWTTVCGTVSSDVK